MTWEYIARVGGPMLSGATYTLGLFFITIIISLPLGLLLVFMRRSKIAPVRWLCGAYVGLMRGTPLLLQLFFFYYGMCFIPLIGSWWGSNINAFTAACIAFCLNYAAYFCEIYRGGLLSIDKGQFEAAKVLGFNKFQTYTKIILPQMFRVVLPSISNESITLVKDTALITSIAVSEIIHAAKVAVNRDSNPSAYIVAAVIYLLMNFVLTRVFAKLEKKFSYE